MRIGLVNSIRANLSGFFRTSAALKPILMGTAFPRRQRAVTLLEVLEHLPDPLAPCANWRGSFPRAAFRTLKRRTGPTPAALSPAGIWSDSCGRAPADRWSPEGMRKRDTARGKLLRDDEYTSRPSRKATDQKTPEASARRRFGGPSRQARGWTTARNRFYSRYPRRRTLISRFLNALRIPQLTKIFCIRSMRRSG